MIGYESDLSQNLDLIIKECLRVGKVNSLSSLTRRLFSMLSLVIPDLGMLGRVPGLGLIAVHGVTTNTDGLASPYVPREPVFRPHNNL